MKIAFDRFHVAKHLGDAVDKVRRAEHRALVKEGNGILLGTKWQWLKGPSRKTHAESLACARLRAGTRRTAQAWELKEAAANPWNYRSRTWENLGAGRMAPVAGVGIGLRSGPGPEHRPDDPGASSGESSMDHPPRHQRTGGRHQQQDQDREGPQPRLSQPGTLRERHPLPPRRPRSLHRWPTRMTRYPPERRKHPPTPATPSTSLDRSAPAGASPRSVPAADTSPASPARCSRPAPRP